MEYIYMIIFFLLGMHMASFYTVVGMRLPLEEDIVKKPSHCDNCGHQLNFLDMVPVLSYLVLRGRCRYCKTKISPMSTYMEIVIGLLFSFAYYRFGLTKELLIGLGIISLFAIISVADIKYLVIPDEVVLTLSIYFATLYLIYERPIELIQRFGSGILLFIIMYLIMYIGNKIFKKETLGGGDIKLMFTIGFVLGPHMGVFSIFLASLIALPISIIIMLKYKNNLIPFGPFLVLSMMIIYFINLNIDKIINIIKLI